MAPHSVAENNVVNQRTLFPVVL